MIKKLLFSTFFLIVLLSVNAQDYFLKAYAPFDKKIKSPEEFLGYPIGQWHTRHDLMVQYFEYLASVSENAELLEYGRTHEQRRLVMLVIADKALLEKKEAVRKQHLEFLEGNKRSEIETAPLIVYLGHNIHGNEPSGGESSLLTAYTLLASQNPQLKAQLKQGIVFIDPAINPDGRDRHAMWANTHKADPLIADPQDVEHNEMWPGGRTNHYWFDLNRDLWLAVHPESQSRLDFFHQWYPNLASDFHEMGTNSTFFFEPKKKLGLQKTLLPEKNHNYYNPLFAKEFARVLDSIGTFYFSAENFDANYPGYGSTYLDMQGGLSLLFEQASSRGHVQQSVHQLLTFEHTIRNQFLMAITTLKTGFDHKSDMMNYQADFFLSAIENARKSKIKAYVFGDNNDKNRTKAFIQTLLRHNVEIYPLAQNVTFNGKNFESGKAFIIPTAQKQYRIVQSAFEAYTQFTDSVWYDASSWSLVHFYNMPHEALTSVPSYGQRIENVDNLFKDSQLAQADYAYLVDWKDYNSALFLSCLHQNDIKVYAAFKPFTTEIEGKSMTFGYGTLMIPVSLQKISADELYLKIQEIKQKTTVSVFATNSGYSSQGSHFGSSNFQALTAPKVLTFVHGSVSSYEAGEVWFAFDKRMHYPVTKARIDQFNRIDLTKYNTIVMVSGSYSELDSSAQARLKMWAASGNTLITSRTANTWLIKNKLVAEQLYTEKKEGDKKANPLTERLPYADAAEKSAAMSIGGILLEAEIDRTHPLGFGYTQQEIPVYRNSSVFIRDSQNPYSTVVKYTENPLINGFIKPENLEKVKNSASLIVSPIGRGRAIMFADNPNFRGTLYGTNKLFFNAVFLGDLIRVPR